MSNMRDMTDEEIQASYIRLEARFRQADRDDAWLFAANLADQAEEEATEMAGIPAVD